jgi:hypothetical protein
VVSVAKSFGAGDGSTACGGLPTGKAGGGGMSEKEAVASGQSCPEARGGGGGVAGLTAPWDKGAVRDAL